MRCTSGCDARALIQLSGLLTLTENIADNGGIRVSYDALRKWLDENNYDDALLPGLNMTHVQQFFLGYAQVRALHRMLSLNCWSNYKSFLSSNQSDSPSQWRRGRRDGNCDLNVLLVGNVLPQIQISWLESREGTKQGRRSLWDRGDTSPQYLDRGDIITNVPPIFLE